MGGNACRVHFSSVCQVSGLIVIDRLIHFVGTFGASKESATDRDGILSYAAESHAAGAGLGVGFLLAVSGYYRLFGAVYFGLAHRNRKGSLFSGQLLEDIQKETQYFLGGLVAGAVLGRIIRYTRGMVSGD